MERKNVSKFKILGNRKKNDNNLEIPFFPKYETEYLYEDNLRITWFEKYFSQSKYNYENEPRPSNACTLIAVLTAANCEYNCLKIDGPNKSLNNKMVYALAFGMLFGNAIHINLSLHGVLKNLNLTVPEAIRYGGNKVTGIHEWKSEYYTQPMNLTLFDHLKDIWIEWYQRCVDLKKRNMDLYVVLICDHRSVLFIMQEKHDTVTLIDSHQHSKDRGAFIATVDRNRLKLLCHWFSELIYRCYKSTPEVYELAFLSFKNKNSRDISKKCACKRFKKATHYAVSPSCMSLCDIEDRALLLTAIQFHEPMITMD